MQPTLPDTYRPARPVRADAGPKVLPNLDIVATGEVPVADQLVLSAYATQTGDRVWTASRTSLLTAVDAGRDLAEFTGFLDQRTEHDLPSTLTTPATDAQRRAGQITDLGPARVIECADAATATSPCHTTGS